MNDQVQYIRLSELAAQDLEKEAALARECSAPKAEIARLLHMAMLCRQSQNPTSLRLRTLL